MADLRPHVIQFLINFTQLSVVQNYCIGNVLPQTHHDTELHVVIYWERAVSLPPLPVARHSKGEDTPAAAGANVYGECVTMFNQFMCVQTMKKNSFSRHGP